MIHASEAIKISINSNPPIHSYIEQVDELIRWWAVRGQRKTVLFITGLYVVSDSGDLQPNLLQTSVIAHIQRHGFVARWARNEGKNSKFYYNIEVMW